MSQVLSRKFFPFLTCQFFFISFNLVGLFQKKNPLWDFGDVHLFKLLALSFEEWILHYHMQSWLLFVLDWLTLSCPGDSRVLVRFWNELITMFKIWNEQITMCRRLVAPNYVHITVINCILLGENCTVLCTLANHSVRAENKWRSENGVELPKCRWWLIHEDSNAAYYWISRN